MSTVRKFLREITELCHKYNCAIYTDDGHGSKPSTAISFDGGVPLLDFEVWPYSKGAYAKVYMPSKLDVPNSKIDAPVKLEWNYKVDEQLDK